MQFSSAIRKSNVLFCNCFIATGMCKVPYKKDMGVAIFKRYIASVYLATGNCEELIMPTDTYSSSAGTWDRYRTHIKNLI